MVFFVISDFEKRKKHPAFTSEVFKKNTELLFFPSMKLHTEVLSPVTSLSSASGKTKTTHSDIYAVCI